MNIDLEGLVIVALLGYAAGATVFASLIRGKRQETVVIVPDPEARGTTNAGCGLLLLAGVVVCVLILFARSLMS